MAEKAGVPDKKRNRERQERVIAITDFISSSYLEKIHVSDPAHFKPLDPLSAEIIKDRIVSE